MDDARIHLEPATVNGYSKPGEPHGVAVAPTQELTDQIRRLRIAARQTGERVPGRPALAAATGATEHQVRKILDEITREEAATLQVAPADTSVAASPIGALPDHSPTPSLDEDQPAEPTPIEISQVHDSADPRRHRRPPSWPLVIIGLAAAISVCSGWVGLGQLAGFGMIQPLPGIWNDLRINTAVVLPISVEAYAAYALRCWLTAHTITPRARTFARRSAITSLIIGAAAQIAFHLMTAAGLNHAPWPVTVGVATIPVIVLGLATALANLIGDGRGGAA
jgi:hypothetical protein